jgi:23S rRNA (guanosine2251-2'-O)-methyltransferase
VIALARERGVPVRTVDWQPADNASHQGIGARVDPYPYVEFEAVLEHAGRQSEPPLFLLLDQVQDPQNLGTLLRAAEAVGVHGVVLPLGGAAGVTPAVVSASAGACEHLRIARANLAQAIRRLKEEAVWIVGLDLDPSAVPLDEADLRGPLAVAVGSEGRGLRRLVRESCDYRVRIPMRGKVESLNAAVAGSLVLYEVWRRAGYAGRANGKPGAAAAPGAGERAGPNLND